MSGLCRVWDFCGSVGLRESDGVSLPLNLNPLHSLLTDFGYAIQAPNSGLASGWVVARFRLDDLGFRVCGLTTANPMWLSEGGLNPKPR